jgi:hypothetical protein
VFKGLIGVVKKHYRWKFLKIDYEYVEHIASVKCGDYVRDRGNGDWVFNERCDENKGGKRNTEIYKNTKHERMEELKKHRNEGRDG